MPGEREEECTMQNFTDDGGNTPTPKRSSKVKSKYVTTDENGRYVIDVVVKRS